MNERASKSSPSTFTKIKVARVEELRDAFRHISETPLGFIFRGQRAKYNLQTSFERACTTAHVPLTEAPTWEAKILREFKRRYHHYSTHKPHIKDDVEWLALMQHHGAPTRFLDWTYSFEIATYFALKASADPEEDAAIWAIDSRWAVRETANLFRIAGKASAEKYIRKEPKDYKDNLRFSEFFMRDNPPACAYPINPYRLNERLSLQHGIFMCPGDVTKPFEENLRAMPHSDLKQNVVAFVLPGKEIQKGLYHCYEQNITNATLFPGLDGFARMLSINFKSASPRTAWLS